jgi:hypothetical protein
VDDNDKAVHLLKTKLGIENCEIGGKGEIFLGERLDKPDEISRLMVENGLSLYTIKQQETTLEEYFIKLIGGVLND